jgi:hypothetical protein
MIRFILFAAMIFVCSALHAQEFKTVVHDKNEAELLLGRHPITTPDFWPFGSSVLKGQSIVYKEKDVFFMQGGQIGFFEVKGDMPWGGAHLVLRGKITEIHHKGFIFDGVVKTELFLDGNWTACVRQGEFEFSRDMRTGEFSDKESEDHMYGEDFWGIKKSPQAYDLQGRDCSPHYSKHETDIDMMVRSLGFVDGSD